MKLKTTLAIIIPLVTLIIYSQTAWYDFTGLDVQEYITDNPHVLAGLSPESIKWAFTSTYASHWHPLTWLSHMLDCQLFGLNPQGPHILNILLHASNSLLLFLLLSYMTGTVVRSAFVAACFALHPLHVESVAWVAERKDVLSTLFWMLTLFFYAYYVKKKSPKYYLLCLISFVLGLMAKAMLVTIPVILLFIDYWPLERHKGDKPTLLKTRIIEKLPFLSISVASSVLTFYGQSHDGNVIPITNFPLVGRIGNSAVSYLKYLLKMIWPFDLSFYYPLPIEPLPFWKIVGVVLILAGATYVALKVKTSFPYITFGWLWYVVTFLPVIGLVQLGGQAMADRYTYIPMIGVYTAICWTAAAIGERLPKYRSSFIAAGIFLLIALSSITWGQIGYWKSNISLYTHAINIDDRNYAAHIFLGEDYLIGQGNIEKAKEQFIQALKITPSYFAYYDLGRACYMQNNFALAESYLTASLMLHDGAKTHYMLGRTLVMLGKNDLAIEQFFQALKQKPYFAECHLELGSALLQQGKQSEADGHISEALRLKPDIRERQPSF